MRILQINKFFYRRGGSESYYFDLSKLLLASGHEVIPFSVKDKRNEPSPYDNFFVDKVSFSGRTGIASDIKKFFHSVYSFEAKRKLEKLIVETKPDVAHLHNISHHISPSIFSVLRKYKIPVVQTLHDYQLICPNFKLFTEGAVCERCKKYRYWNAVRHKCVHNSRLESLAEALEMCIHKTCQIYENGVYCFVTPSEFLRRKLADWGAGGSAKIEVIHNFIDTAAFSAGEEMGDYAIYFGRLAEEKGLETLLRALVGTDIKMKIVGDGPAKNKLLSLAKELNTGAEFIGYKSGAELNDMVGGSRFVVLPAIWYENYPMSLLEAGAMGKAVVASRLGGITEIIRDGENGLLANPGDADDFRKKIQALWDDIDLCRRMGGRAHGMVIEKNSPDGHCRKIIDLYELAKKNN